YNCETLGYSETDSSCSSFRVSGDICLTPSSGSSVAKRSLEAFVSKQTGEADIISFSEMEYRLVVREPLSRSTIS
ncbi:hypothetical protein Tco_1116885, partial [Tanacetum coccineum]